MRKAYHSSRNQLLRLTTLKAMSGNSKHHKPLKGFFGSIPKPSVKDSNSNPGAYYKQNQKQCMKHIVARLNARLSHWDTGALEQMVIFDMSLERLAQREYRFFFMQDASARKRKYAPFAPPTEDDIQVWKREFQKAGNECQRIVRARFGILQAYKIPMIELWDYESLYKRLWSSNYLRVKCIERGGCCARSCGCCQGTRKTKRSMAHSHCRLECHCCLYHRRGDLGAVDVRAWVLKEAATVTQESSSVHRGSDTSSNETTLSLMGKKHSARAYHRQRPLEERKPSPLRTVESCY